MSDEEQSNSKKPAAKKKLEYSFCLIENERTEQLQAELKFAEKIETKLEYSQLATILPKDYSEFIVNQEALKQLDEAFKQQQNTNLIIATKKPVWVEMQFNEKEATLQAIFSISNNLEQKFDASQFRQDFENSDYKEFRVDEAAFASIAKHAQARELDPIDFAYKEDAQINLLISDDQMQASMQITPACGGEDVKLDYLKLFLGKEKITGLVADKALEQAIKQAEHESVVIAQGTPPIEGEPTIFTPIFTKQKVKPRQRADGTVDIRDVAEFHVVEPNEVLMERIPAILGKAGINVLGEPIEPQLIEDKPFVLGEGCCVNPDNPYQVLATNKGHPVYSPEGVTVDNTLSLENVDVNTGHIDFDGSVKIAGDVLEGMRICATGDIYVGGSVYSSELVAEGSIFVKAGISGDRIKDNEQLLPEDQYKTLITAQKNIYAKFVNLSYIKAGSDIAIEDYSYHSYIITEGHLFFGEPKGKGMIIGGQLHARTGLTANQIGNDKEIPGNIHVGITPEEFKRYQKIRTDVNHRATELLQLSYILDKVRKQPAKKLGQVIVDKAKKVAQTFMEQKQLLDKLKKEIAPLEERVNSSYQVEISCNKAIYPMVTLGLNQSQLKIKEEKIGQTCFHLIGKKIKIKG